jgi:hypothetical protein
MREKMKSYSRRMGAAFGVAYIVAALHMVFIHGKDFPDIPPILSMTICALYGLNRASRLADVVSNNTGKAPKTNEA